MDDLNNLLLTYIEAIKTGNEILLAFRIRPIFKAQVSLEVYRAFTIIKFAKFQFKCHNTHLFSLNRRQNHQNEFDIFTDSYHLYWYVSIH